MIKTGFTTKEIAAFLSVSPFTIESHRSNLRKKLNLDNEKINLATYLQSL
jgi:DNA-binding CsgD family transcriptional regulator